MGVNARRVIKDGIGWDGIGRTQRESEKLDVVIYGLVMALCSGVVLDGDRYIFQSGIGTRMHVYMYA